MKQASRTFLIAITGGIASGKSTVSNWFKDHGFIVYYADKIGHEMLENQAIAEQLILKFGAQITSEKKIDRIKLSSYVFSHPASLGFLNKLLHPAIRKRMQELIDKSVEEKLIFEIPLLFEGDLDKSFDLVINVHVNHETQITRLISRSNFTRKEAENRIKSQLPTLTKIEQADVNVDNNGTLSQLRYQLEKLMNNFDSFPRKVVVPII